MMHRRKFMGLSTLFAGALLSSRLGHASDDTAWFMPDEGDPHARTWMAFGASPEIWGAKLMPAVQRNLALLANTIAAFEPLTMLVRRRDIKKAKSLISKQVTLLECEINDLWIRDTGPSFVVTDSGRKGAVNLNFNGWGEKQEYNDDAGVASFVARSAGVREIACDFILEGGCIEVDGHGLAIMTESCTLNDNRNPGVNKRQFESHLGEVLGLDKIIWLPGIRGRDITDGHTDFYARFAAPGVVLAGFDPDPDSYDHKVTLRHLELLRNATDAKGRKLEVITLEAPRTLRREHETDEFAAGYIGFYLCNGAVIAQEFGDSRADKAAKEALQHAFPKREIIQLNMDAIAAGGGTIHCATQQEPRV